MHQTKFNLVIPRIHETNLKKQGMLPLTFNNKADYELVKPDDPILIPFTHLNKFLSIVVTCFGLCVSREIFMDNVNEHTVFGDLTGLNIKHFNAILTGFSCEHLILAFKRSSEWIFPHPEKDDGGDFLGFREAPFYMLKINRGGGQVSNLTMAPGIFESKCLLFKSRHEKGYTSFQS